ncbi:ABC transporter permease [Leptolyngbya sp. PCC 6406]|uniref:ABC transporter permease n=1 Tax=Leptolyngbya sp. PCC 6406 TaxID=1173264 RepID=UPI0002ACA741|nr:iron ABC transporter permease [Leptolyngbya sp. PCC 6406]
MRTSSFVTKHPSPSLPTHALKWLGGSGRSARPPWFLVLMALVTAAAMVLPLSHLVVRAAGAGVLELWAIIARPLTLEVIFNTLGLGLAATFFSALIAIPLAFLTVRTDLPGRRFWLIATTLPLAVPTYVGSFALISAFGPRGSIVQMLLQPLGIERLPSIYGWFGVITATTLFTFPYLLLSVRAGLIGMDPSTEEAARSLGHSPYSTFLRVTLPQLRPSIAAGSLLVALYAIQDFGTPALMQFDSFTRVIFTQYRSGFNRNLAAALALVLVAIVLGILWLEYRTRTRAAYYTRRSGSGLLTPPVALGRWRWPALFFCTIVVLLSLVMPVGVILFWLFRSTLFGGLGYTTYQSVPLWQICLNSLYGAGLAALVATVFALPIAILSVRFPGRWTTLLERCSYIGFGTPGIVVALALVFFGANYTPWIYQQMPMLVFAYMVLFLPQAVGTVRGSLLQVNPNLEESARSLGRTPWQTLRQITLPLVQPGVLSGAMLIFLTAIKELPATLLLAPIGFRTLAMQIWQATAEDAAFADAAAAALLILLVSAGSTLIILSQERRTVTQARPNS